VNLGSMAKTGNTPHEAIPNPVLTRAMIYAMLLQVSIMLMGIFRQAVMGQCTCAHHTEVLAAGQQWVAN
jgi:hypothetical protein